MPRKVWLVGGLALVVAAVATVWWLRRPADGFLTGMAPIDGTRSVFTMRANYPRGPSRAWIGVVDAEDEGVVWSRELPGETCSVCPRHGLTVSDTQVTVKVLDTQDTSRVLAFDLASGEELWRSAAIDLQPSEVPDTLFFVPGDRPHDDGRQVFHADHDRAAARLVARDASTGVTQWSRDIPEVGVRELTFAPETALVRADTWSFLRREDGSVARELDVNGDACIDPQGRLVAWDDDTLVRIDLADPATPPEERPLSSVGHVLGCGTHADRLVFTVVSSQSPDGHARLEMLAVSGEAPAIDWRVDLGRWELFDIANTHDNRGREAATHRGPLPDYVPLLLGAHGVDEFQLVVIDVARGALAWASQPHAELLHFQLYRGSGSQQFLSNRSRIIAIDGGSGEVTAAVDLGHETSRSFHAVDGRLWSYSMDWQRMNELPWVVLDGRTLEVLGRGNDTVSPVDTTQATIAWLGAKRPGSSAGEVR